MSGGVFVGMNNAIMGGLNAVLEGQSSVYGSMISVIAVSSFTAFIMFRGYQTLAGKLQTPFEDVAWDFGRLLLILMFVLNLSGWLDLTISAIDGLKNGVSGDDNVWMILDTVWGKAQKLGQTLYDMDDSTYVKINGGFSEILVWGGAIFVLIVSTVVILLAGITILLLSTTAPIFIFCLSYGFLKPMFNNWLQTIFTAILTILFASLFLRICIKYMNSILDAAALSSEANNMVTLAAQCLLAAIGAGVIVWFSAKIAHALSGVAVQGVMQGVAKAGGNSVGSKFTNAARSGSGAIGDRAANNLQSGGSASSTQRTGETNAAWKRRSASINTIQRMNQQRR